MLNDAQEQLEQIGAQLRIARVKAYLSQGDVGQRAGVSRQLVSRIEQGRNGEISAYVAVAAALNHRFIVEEQAAMNDGDMADAAFTNGMAALDFTSETTPVNNPQPRVSGGGKKAKRSRSTKENQRGARG